MKAKIDRSKIEREQEVIKANTEYEVSIVNAQEKASVLITKAEGEKAIAESKMQAEVVETCNKARAAANAKKKHTEEKVEIMGIEAQSRYEATKAKYAALLEEGKSELKNLEGFEA